MGAPTGGQVGRVRDRLAWKSRVRSQAQRNPAYRPGEGVRKCATKQVQPRRDDTERARERFGKVAADIGECPRHAHRAEVQYSGYGDARTVKGPDQYRNIDGAERLRASGVGERHRAGPGLLAIGQDRRAARLPL